MSKTPGTEAEPLLLLNGTSAGGLDTSAYLNAELGEFATSLFASYNRSDAYDPADIGLSAIPEFERWTFNPRLFRETPRSTLTLGLNAVVEDRLGGDMQFIDGKILSIPDALPTSLAYTENSETTRLATQLDYKRQLEAGRELVLRNSVSRFSRDLTVPGFSFSGTQVSSFSELHISGQNSTSDWVVGANLWTEDFDDEANQSRFSQDFSDHTLGAFVQGTLDLKELWSLEAGLRLDTTSDFGNFFLPRFSLLHRFSPATDIRVGGGLGYKSPTVFTEEAERLQFQNILPLELGSLQAEESVGLNFDINHRIEFAQDLGLNVNFLMFYTRVDDPLRLVQDDQGLFRYQQPIDYLDTQGVEFNSVLNWQFYKLFLGYTYTNVNEHRANSSKAAVLVPEDRLNAVLVYELEDSFRIGLESYYYGSQKLSDGSRSRDYWIVGLMMEKALSNGSSVFLNFENFSDTRQTRYGPIYSGSLSDPQFMDIYAPLDGFVINGGFKIRF